MAKNGEGARTLVENAKHPKKMIIIEMDVTKDTDIECAYQIVRSCMTYSEDLFGLVNNAGIAIVSELEFGPDLQECNKILDVNLMGMIKVTRQFLPLIRQAKGRIVNIESLAALVPIPNAIFYGISKSGAAGFSDNLRITMYKFGVSVVSINPWLYRTAITDARMLINQYENTFRNSSEEVRKAYGEMFIQKAKIGMSTAKIATKSNAVPDTVVSALTVYEPDPRYVIAPIILQPILYAMLWMPKESLEVCIQITSWIFGMHKAYPDN